MKNRNQHVRLRKLGGMIMINGEPEKRAAVKIQCINYWNEIFDRGDD